MEKKVDGRRGVMSRPDCLSPMEGKVMKYLVRGMTVNCAAEELGISRNTADTYVRRIYAKLGVHSRAEAVFRFAGGALSNA